MQRLGGSVIHFNEATSSVKKGESMDGRWLILCMLGNFAFFVSTQYFKNKLMGFDNTFAYVLILARSGLGSLCVVFAIFMSYGP